LSPEASEEPVKEIEHLVVLMMENRSFDHHFGALNFAPELRRDDVPHAAVGQ
jgi:phospholipase C